MTDTPELAAETKTCPRCAEDVKAAALVCRFCGHEFAASVPPIPPPPPPGTATPEGPGGPVAAPPAKRPRPRRSLRTAVILVVLIVTAVALVSSRMRGTAGDPGDLARRFPQAGVTCRDMDVIYNDRSSKALGCAGTKGEIITVTTYGSRPAPDAWVKDWCATVDEPRQGAYVAGDGFIIEIHQGPYPADLLGEPPTAIDTATRLVAVVGGTAASYACP